MSLLQDWLMAESKCEEISLSSSWVVQSLKDIMA